MLIFDSKAAVKRQGFRPKFFNENNFVTVQGGGFKRPVALTLWAKIAINYPEGELQEFRSRPALRGEVWGLVLAGK